jgi:predicted metal-dependent hydrolase
MGRKMKRQPQLSLQLDTQPPDTAARWHDGAALAYLGGFLTLRLATGGKEVSQAGSELHLPLPPAATARQIQDAAESWLRARALQVIGTQVAVAARRHRRAVPRIVLSFAAHGHWLEPDEHGLRCHWRLIEQPPAAIAKTVERALLRLPHNQTSLDLFAFA